MYQVPPQQPPIHAVPPDVIFEDSFGPAAQDPEREQLLAPQGFLLIWMAPVQVLGHYV